MYLPLILELIHEETSSIEIYNIWDIQKLIQNYSIVW